MHASIFFTSWFFDALIILMFLIILGSALWVVKSTSLFAIVMVTGVFSFASCILYTLMGAADVALTESAVGVGISTLLSFLTIFITTKKDVPKNSPSPNYHFSTNKLVFVSMIFMSSFLMLILLVNHLPPFGNIGNPTINDTYYYYKNSGFIGGKIPNMVTSVLGSFRAFDTLGETLVVVIAAISVTALISENPRKKEK